MKAVRLNGWGQPVQLEDVPQPEPGNDEVLVRVHAASINPLDAAVHAGYLQGMLNVPLTLGTDFSGEVVETGSGIEHVRPGDAVFGLVPFHSGSFAEYLVAKPNEVTHKPKTLDHVRAAGVPLASLAGYQTLVTLGQAQKGEKILIIGAGGSAGGTAIQLAKDLGAYVFAVTHPEKADHVRKLGADRYINKLDERYEDVVGTVDLVLDYIYGEHTARAYKVLKPGGRYVTTLVYEPDQAEPERLGIRSMGIGTQARVDQLDDLARRIDAGTFKTFVNRTFPLSEAQAALEYRMQTTKPGKVILTVL